MKKYRFGIDIDGTVTCPTSLLPHINEQFGCNLELNDIKEYELTAAFPVDKQAFYDWYRQAEAHIYSVSPVHANAKSILTSWSSMYELYYISARGHNVFTETIEWFQREEIPYDHIELIGTHRKIEAAKQFGVHAFFEDKHDNAVDLHEELDIPVLLFDTPYNQEPIPKGVIRVKDWQEANEWIQRLFPVETSIK